MEASSTVSPTCNLACPWSPSGGCLRQVTLGWPQQLPLWSHIPSIALASYTSNVLNELILADFNCIHIHIAHQTKPGLFQAQGWGICSKAGGAGVNQARADGGTALTPGVCGIFRRKQSKKQQHVIHMRGKLVRECV